MRFVIGFLAMTLVALGVGFGLSYLALTDRTGIGTYRLGPWVTWPGLGAPDPDPYTRSHIARSGALPIGRSEGIEFVAETDTSGEPLSALCNYKVAGLTPVATFWTLYAAAPDGTNIARPGAEGAINSTRINHAADGHAEIHVGASLAGGNWLEISGNGRFRLVLNLYDAAVFSGLGSDVSGLPDIIREACL